MFSACCAKILQNFECKFPMARDRFISAFETILIPVVKKMAEVSLNDSIRSLALLSPDALSGNSPLHSFVNFLTFLSCIMLLMF